VKFSEVTPTGIHYKSGPHFDDPEGEPPTTFCSDGEDAAEVFSACPTPVTTPSEPKLCYRDQKALDLVNLLETNDPGMFHAEHLRAHVDDVVRSTMSLDEQAPEAAGVGLQHCLELPYAVYNQVCPQDISVAAVSRETFEERSQSLRACTPVAFTELVDPTDLTTSGSMGTLVFFDNGEKAVFANEDVLRHDRSSPTLEGESTRQRLRQRLERQRQASKAHQMEALRPVGGVVPRPKHYRGKTSVVRPVDGRPPTVCTPEMRAAINAESEKGQVVRTAYESLNIMKNGVFQNVFTKDDLLEENMVHVDWVPDYQSRLKAMGKVPLRPVPPAQLEVVMKQIRAFRAAGWVERYIGRDPEVVHPMFCIKKDTEVGKPQEWRAIVDGTRGNSLCIPATGPVDTMDSVFGTFQKAARESLRQIEANRSGKRKTVPTDRPITADDNWLTSEGEPHPEAPPRPTKPAGHLQRIVGDSVEFGKRYPLPTEVWCGTVDATKAFQRLKVKEGVSRARLAFSAKGLNSIWCFKTAAMGFVNSPSEWSRALRRKLRYFGVLADEDVSPSEIFLDPTPIEILLGFAPGTPVPGFDAGDSLASVGGFPPPQSFLCLYVDDMFVINASEDEHIRALKFLGMILHLQHLYVGSDTMIIGAELISTLGMVCNHKVVMADPKRVEDINKQMPCTLERRWGKATIRRFVGQMNFFRAFLDDASRYLRPINALLALKDVDTGDKIPTADVSLFWTIPCDVDDPKVATHWITLHGRHVGKRVKEYCCLEGFNLAKESLAQLCLRYQPDPYAQWVCATDSSQYGYGILGTQEDAATGKNVPCFVHGGPFPPAMCRKPATIRELKAAHLLWVKEGKLLMGSNPTTIIITDHAANHNIQDRIVVNLNEALTIRLDMERYRPYKVIYSQGPSAILSVPDCMSRLVQCGGEALPEDSRDIFTSIEDIPALKWVFNELDKQQEFGNLVGAVAAADSDSLTVNEMSEYEDAMPRSLDGMPMSQPLPNGHDVAVAATITSKSQAMHLRLASEVTDEVSLQRPDQASEITVIVYQAESVYLTLAGPGTGHLPEEDHQSRTLRGDRQWAPPTQTTSNNTHSLPAAMKVITDTGQTPEDSSEGLEYVANYTMGHGGRRAIYASAVTPPRPEGLGQWFSVRRLPPNMSHFDQSLIGAIMRRVTAEKGRRESVQQYIEERLRHYKTRFPETVRVVNGVHASSSVADFLSSVHWKWIYWLLPVGRNNSPPDAERGLDGVTTDYEAKAFISNDQLRTWWIQGATAIAHMLIRVKWSVLDDLVRRLRQSAQLFVLATESSDPEIKAVATLATTTAEQGPPHWRFEGIVAAPAKPVRRRLCPQSPGIYITVDNDTFAKAATWLNKHPVAWEAVATRSVTKEQLQQWNEERDDLEMATMRSKFRSGTRLRYDGASTRDDSKPPMPALEDEISTTRLIAETLARRGYYVGDAVRPDARSGPTPARLKPKDYRKSPYAAAYKTAGPVQNRQGFLTAHGYLYHVDNTNGNVRLVVPLVEQQREVLEQIHVDFLGKHLGGGRTFAAAKRDVYWRTMARDVQRYVASCDHCQRNKHVRLAEHGSPTAWLGEPACPGIWHCDMICGLPDSKSAMGWNAVMVLVCRWSSFVVAVPTHNTLDSIGWATMIYKELVCRLGETPRCLVTDRAPIFTSEFTVTWCALLGVGRTTTTAHRSTRVNAKVEITIQQLEAALRNADLSQTSWLTRLLPACGVVNTSGATVTGISAVEMRTGRKPMTSIALSPGVLSDCKTTVAEHALEMQRLWEECTEAMVRARRQQTEKSTKRQSQPHWTETLKVGDLMMVESKTLTTPAFRAGLVNRKTEPRYYGPYKVLSFVACRTVELELPAKSQAWPEFHISRIKPYKAPDGTVTPTSEIGPLPQATKSEIDYEVSTVEAKRVRLGRTEYLVKWAKPYHAQEHMTWESEANLAGAPDAIKRFQERQVALQEFDASQRMDFDHLMAPVLPVATIQPVLDAITAMGLQLNYYTTGVF
jgi:hypothetical protein